MKKLNLICVFVFGIFLSNAQHLTISTTGETGTSGTNWSFVGNTLQIASSGSATIHPDVISNHLTNTGDLIVDLPYVNTLRNINITSSINFTGSINRSLYFKSAADITVASGVSISATSAQLNIVFRTAVNPGLRGSLTLNGVNLSTNGGHLWAGGGSVDVIWNGLIVGDQYARTFTENQRGLSFVGSTITTAGGDIVLKGRSNANVTTGVNYGLYVDNATITSGVGNITIDGSISGKFTNGVACNFESILGAINISSTSGQIICLGNGVDYAGTGNGWRLGLQFCGQNFPVVVSTSSGSINLEGNANYLNNTIYDVEGLNLRSNGANLLKIVSQSGSISIKGSNTKENGGQFTNSIRFSAANFTNAIVIGYDGVTNYSGNILIEGNSIYQRSNNAGSGSISIQSLGSLTIQPSSTTFSYVRSGDSGTLNFDNDWNFGTTLSSFTYGKSTTTSTLIFSNFLTTSGAINFNTGIFNLDSDLTSLGGTITLNAATNFVTYTTTRRTISTNGGDIFINADADANASGVLDLDYLTCNPGTGNTVIRGETFFWTTTSTSTKPYINGTGSITVESSDASFGQEIQTLWFQFDQDNNGMNNVFIGKPTNAFSVVINQGYSYNLTGKLEIYGTTLTVSSPVISSSSQVLSAFNGSSVIFNENISSTSNGAIYLTTNALSFAAGKAIMSGGKLIIKPQAVSTTIGIGGATGTLQLPASYFTTNFTNGFSSIEIGSASHTGAITAIGFSLQDNVSLLTKGNVVLGGFPMLNDNNLALGDSVAGITGIPTYYFKTNGTGKVIRSIANGATFNFPIGNSSYNPLSVTNNSGSTDAFSAKVMDGLYVNGVSGTVVSSTSVNKTWDITKTTGNAGSGVDFVFNWNAGDVVNGSFYVPEMNHFNGSIWEVPTVSSSIVGTNSLIVTGYTGTFSPFSIQEGSGLPVELTSFNANCTESGTSINWQTASEHNSAYFDVEKSRDGSNWFVLETISAAGNSTTVIDYSVLDSEKSSNEVVYYRLNQVDVDGASKIYGPISLSCMNNDVFTAFVYPNPTKENTTLELNTTSTQTVAIYLFGTEGKIIYQSTQLVDAGSTILPLSIDELKAGVYSLQVKGESSLKTIKLVVQ